MKKVFLGMLFGAFSIAAASVFISCESKKEAQKIGEYELLENNGKFGLKDGSHVILNAEYDEISEVADYKAIFAKKDAETTVVINGYVLFAAPIDSIVPTDEAEFVYIYSSGTVRLWQKGTSYIVGPFTDVRLMDDIVFLNEEGKWGAATTNRTGLAPRKFDKIFVVKNKDKLAVVVKDASSGWAMYDQDGVSDGMRYNTSSKQLERELKKLKLVGDIGVVEVTWPL